MPAFKYQGRPVLGFIASKLDPGLHLFSPAADDALRDELGGFILSKGTSRLTPDNPIPEATSLRLIVARLREIAAAT